MFFVPMFRMLCISLTTVVSICIEPFGATRAVGLAVSRLTLLLGAVLSSADATPLPVATPAPAAMAPAAMAVTAIRRQALGGLLVVIVFLRVRQVFPGLTSAASNAAEARRRRVEVLGAS
jgi:hypothetical protein